MIECLTWIAGRNPDHRPTRTELAILANEPTPLDLAQLAAASARHQLTIRFTN